MLKSLKARLLGVFAFVASLASTASAAVTVNSSTGEVTGSLDLAPFMSMFGLVIVAAAGIWAAKRALGLIRG